MSTNLKLLPAELAGVFVLQPKIFTDQRGTFVKTYHADIFREAGLDFTPREEFFSISHKNVVRGMHFQSPPAAQDKLVYCPVGKVLDVVMDLRPGSRTFGGTFARELSAENREMLYIPVGCAHGFLSLAEDTIMVYQTSTVHSPTQDAGILWNSIGFDWPVKNPILSARDQAFPTLNQFQSPF